jgi:hypothetical protein
MGRAMKCVVLAAFAALCVVSCRAPRTEEPRAQARRTERVSRPRPEAPAERTQVDWPGALIVADAAGPVLFRRSAPSSRGFAWIAAGMPIVPRGAVERGRVRVLVDGPVSVRGWMAVDRLEGIVVSRGRVRGTPLYVVPGDSVRLLEVRGSTAMVEGRAQLGLPGVGTSEAFRGTFPISSLGAEARGSGVGPSGGRAISLRNVRALYGEPNGEVVWEIPQSATALPATVLREDGEWLGVRIGLGPYLVGYVPRSALGSSRKKDLFSSEVIDPWADDGDEEPEPEHGAPSGPQLPPMLAEAAVRPVWRIREGARVRVDGATVALFRESGRAVELSRAGSEVVVLAAVDETVTVQGTVRAQDLESLAP